MIDVEQCDRLDAFREQLLRMAHRHVPAQLQGKVDASDIVQQTLLNAHARRDQFQGKTEAELVGWLRRILANAIVDANRTFTGKRDVALERSLESSVTEIASDHAIASDQSTPSGNAIRNEEERRLIEAIHQLPDEQRTAVDLHHLQGYAVSEVARRMQRSEASVAGLLRRGLKALRNNSLIDSGSKAVDRHSQSPEESQ